MTQDFHNFSQSLRDNFGLTYGSGHNRFLPDPFQFIPYQSSCHLTVTEASAKHLALACANDNTFSPKKIHFEKQQRTYHTKEVNVEAFKDET